MLIVAPLKQRLLALQKTHKMLENEGATVTETRVHVLVGHPQPDTGDLGGRFLGNVEVDVHILVVHGSGHRNLQRAAIDHASD